MGVVASILQYKLTSNAHPSAMMAAASVVMIKAHMHAQLQET